MLPKKIFSLKELTPNEMVPKKRLIPKENIAKASVVLHHSQWVEKSDLVEWARRNLVADFRQEDMSTVLDVAKEN